MKQLFIINLTIKKVRHLKDISIPLLEYQMKHLILNSPTGEKLYEWIKNNASE